MIVAELLPSHSQQHGDVQVIFEDATKIQFFFVGAKPLKLKVRNYSNFTITFPTLWRCAGDFFKVLLKFKMAATDQLQFFCGHKTPLKYSLVFLFLNFNIIFLATWGCASDFLKMLRK